uniref:Uncharacterized protein n=1 Tax=Avena sativa TaxID=4498 RepID=A0ACD5W3T3_AVESA
MCSKKLRVLLIPFFATSHIEPYTELAIRLAGARPDHVVEPTLAVTPANVAIVQSLLERRGQQGRVKVATYPFPAVEGLPAGVENLGKVAAADAWRIDAAAISDALMRPAQEALVRAQCPDAIVADPHFSWQAGIADELGVPLVSFSVVGAFSGLAMGHLMAYGAVEDGEDPVVTVPRFPLPEIRMPVAELPKFLRTHLLLQRDGGEDVDSIGKVSVGESFGLAINTASHLEQQYCEMHVTGCHIKRAYFVGPLSLGAEAVAPGGESQTPACIRWLDSKPDRSVVYLCFGSLTHVSDAQLDELALGLEASGRAFVWVVRAAEKWAPPAGWAERVQDRGMLLTAWAPQTAILGHRAVGGFVTHCGWNSVLEAVAASVPVLTWPMVFEQFITERLVTEVMGIGERFWPEGKGRRRSTRYEEHGLVPAEDVARAVTTFMCPGGTGEAKRERAMELAAESRAAMAEGGSSHRDLCRLVDDLVAAKLERE